MTPGWCAGCDATLLGPQLLRGGWPVSRRCHCTRSPCHVPSLGIFGRSTRSVLLSLPAPEALRPRGTSQERCGGGCGPHSRLPGPPPQPPKPDGMSAAACCHRVLWLCSLPCPVSLAAPQWLGRSPCPGRWLGRVGLGPGRRTDPPQSHLGWHLLCPPGHPVHSTTAFRAVKTRRKLLFASRNHVPCVHFKKKCLQTVWE